jgi:hypothetical protein
LTGSGESPYADRKTDSESVDFGLIGTFLGRAKSYVAHSKEENQCGEWDSIRLKNRRNLLILNDLAERVGFESVIKHGFKDIQSTDCI